MSAVREVVRDKAEELAERIEALRADVERKKALSLENATRLSEMETDLAEMKAFLDAGDTNG